MIWFTSDTHFGHANVINLANRPFRDAREMEDALVASINAMVAPSDTLYHLGDFSMKIDVDEEERIMRRLNCRDIHILPGNHDRHLGELAARGLVHVEPPILELKIDGRRFPMAHYPIADWAGKGRGSIHLHGHIHSHGPAYNEACRQRGLLRYDVGVDANGYAPVSLTQILAFFEGVQPSGRMKWQDWIEPLR